MNEPTADPTVKAQMRSLFLPGPAGRLEALLNTGARQPMYAAVVCHPHPLYGGTMHNKVVFYTMKALNGFGFPVLRFNFRGAGLSHGEHDFGQGEVQDVQAAFEWLYAEFRLPMVFAGFSFGAATGLKAACPDPRVAAAISIGTPLPSGDRAYAYEFLQTCRKPKLFVSGDHDVFAPRAALQRLVAAVPEPKHLTLIEGADHFFAGRLEELRQAIAGWVAATLARPNP